MNYRDFSWKIFEKTGDINIYLALKDDFGTDSGKIPYIEDLDEELTFADDLEKETVGIQ